MTPIQLLIERAAQAALLLSGGDEAAERLLAAELREAIDAISAPHSPMTDIMIAWLAVLPTQGYASVVESGQGGRLIADQLFPDDARRIVACVNFLRGIPTTRIERGLTSPDGPVR